MENNKKEYSENNSEEKYKTAAEYGNTPNAGKTDNSGNKSFEKTDDNGYDSAETTGSGYSEAERNVHDDTIGQNPANPNKEDNGSEELVAKYNINDKAYSDSSKEDFVKTVSKFHHADEADDKDNSDK